MTIAGTRPRTAPLSPVSMSQTTRLSGAISRVTDIHKTTILSLLKTVGDFTGRTEAVLSQLGSTILSVMQIVGLERLDRVDPTFIRAYGAPFATPADCKGAIAFPLDLALGRIRDFVREGASGVPSLRDKPALMIEGMLDRAIPPALALADFRGLWPEAPFPP